MAVTSHFPILIFLLSIIFIPLSKSHQTKDESAGDGFAVHLIHRDSPQSPFYDDKMTALDRAVSAANRSISRLKYIRSMITSSPVAAPFSSDISSRLVPDHGEYLMMYNVGTPPTQVYAIADTGSDLIWLQCLPCKKCYNQTQPIFDPSKSSTFTRVSCNSPNCIAVNDYACGRENDQRPCYYVIFYADSSTTRGTLSTDVFAFEDPHQNSVDVGSLCFGCADDTTGSFSEKEHGIVGLNQSPLSLISQLGIRQFSYCMVVPDDEGSGSRMYFGSRAVISGGQTPLKKWSKMFYYVSLEGISIGDDKIPIPDRSFETPDRGFIIDSACTYTMLRSEIFNLVVQGLRRAINLPEQKHPPEPFGLCFAGSFNDLESQPDVTFHFQNTDLMLIKQTTYLEVTSGIWCLAMLPSSDYVSTLGNIQQWNYWVGYDLDGQLLSFAPVDCATF